MRSASPGTSPWDLRHGFRLSGVAELVLLVQDGTHARRIVIHQKRGPAEIRIDGGAPIRVTGESELRLRVSLDGAWYR